MDSPPAYVPRNERVPQRQSRIVTRVKFLPKHAFSLCLSILAIVLVYVCIDEMIHVNDTWKSECKDGVMSLYSNIIIDIGTLYTFVQFILWKASDDYIGSIMALHIVVNGFYLTLIHTAVGAYSGTCFKNPTYVLLFMISQIHFLIIGVFLLIGLILGLLFLLPFDVVQTEEEIIDRV